MSGGTTRTTRHRSLRKCRSLLLLLFSTHLHAVHILPAQATATHAAGRERYVAGGGLHEALEGGRAIGAVVASQLLSFEKRPRHGSISLLLLLPRAEQRHLASSVLSARLSVDGALFFSLREAEEAEKRARRGRKASEMGQKRIAQVNFGEREKKTKNATSTDLTLDPPAKGGWGGGPPSLTSKSTGPQTPRSRGSPPRSPGRPRCRSRSSPA